MKWLHRLTVPKVLTVLCLLGLGINGLIQVGLQRDMGKKAAQLNTQVAAAQSLSGKMKDSLTGLTELRDSTTHMSGTLHALAAATADMNGGLALLSTTVSGIAVSVQALSQSTQASQHEIQSAQQASSSLLALLQQMTDINNHLISGLNQMMTDQSGINADLESMNRKTQMLP